MYETKELRPPSNMKLSVLPSGVLLSVMLILRPLFGRSGIGQGQA